MHPNNGNGSPLWDDLPALVRLNQSRKNRSEARIAGVTQAKLRGNEVLRAVILLGGYAETGRLFGLTPRAPMKWVKTKRLPRTEATGETQYAATMAQANPEINEEALRNTVYRKQKKVRRVSEIGRPAFR